jgi:hypothetical protein
MKHARGKTVVMAITTIVSCWLTASTAYSQDKPVSQPKDSLSTRSPADLRDAFLNAATGVGRAAALAAWEAVLSKQIVSEEAVRKARQIVQVLTPAAGGSLIRCTLSPAKVDSIVVVSLEASGDQIPVSGFQTFAAGSIVRFAGTVRFPFSTRDPFSGSGGLFKLSGYLGRDDSEEARKNGVTNTTMLLPAEWSDSAATFTGDSADPLSFILLDDGLVYFHGTGEVRLKDGTTLTFGSGKQ